MRTKLERGPLSNEGRGLLLGGRLRGGGWGLGFDVGVEPAALFPEHVLETFFGFVAVGF
jgi:hypothetical protein